MERVALFVVCCDREAGVQCWCLGVFFCSFVWGCGVVLVCIFYCSGVEPCLVGSVADVLAAAEVGLVWCDGGGGDACEL